MKMPGFHAESALSPGAGFFRSAAPLAGRAAVEPAALCCSACADICELYPRSRACQGCSRNPCNASC